MKSYSIKAYFDELMSFYASQSVPLLFDFNVVITNLNKINIEEALVLISKLRATIQTSAQSNEKYASEYVDIPLVGKTVFEQQRHLYKSLLKWLDEFESQFNKI